MAKDKMYTYTFTNGDVVTSRLKRDELMNLSK